MSTIADLNARARFFLQEPTQVHWTDVNLNISINRARDLVINALMAVNQEYFGKTATQATTSGIREYNLPADFFKMKKVVNTTKNPDKGLNVTDLNELENIEKGEEQFYYLFGDKIGVFPTPTATETLTLYYYPIMADISGATESGVPKYFEDLLPLYAVIMCLLEDRKNPAPFIAMAQVIEKHIPGLAERAVQLFSTLRYATLRMKR